MATIIRVVLWLPNPAGATNSSLILWLVGVRIITIITSTLTYVIFFATEGFFGAHTTSLESTPTSIAVSNSLATLISADVPCSASVASPTFSAGPVSVQAGVEASVDVNLDAQIQVGIVAAGSLIPPKITELGLTAGTSPFFPS